MKVSTYIRKTLYISNHILISKCNISKHNRNFRGIKMKMHKICPRCGSMNIDWIIPQNWSQCVCRDCDYTGPIIEGNDELIEEIRESYLKSLKDEEEDQ